ncbi:CDP-alcohol phosphatidyltransferase family protein [Nesterenkonia suensis]
MDLRGRPVLGSIAVVIAGALLLGALLGAAGDVAGLLLGRLGEDEGSGSLLGPAEGFRAPAVAAGGIAFVACQLHAVRGGGRFRLADAVTLLRCLLLGIFTAGVGQMAFVGDSVVGEGDAVTRLSVPLSLPLPLPLILLAVLILLLDGLDGAAARAAGGETPAGARYDETSDAVVLLVLAVTAALAVGWWAILLGLLRPAFALGGRLRPAWRRPLEPSRRRKICGVAPGILLLLALAPWPVSPLVPSAEASSEARTLLVALGLVLVTFSFLLDVRRLEKLGKRPPPGFYGRLSQ